MLRRASVQAAVLSVALAFAGSLPAVAQDGPPVVGTAVTFVDPADGLAHGTITVSELADPFTGHDPGSPPPDGSKFVVATVVFEAAADQRLQAEPSWIYLQDTEGRLWHSQWLALPPDAMVPILESQQLSPGNRISGLVAFAVPQDAQVDHVVYWPANDRMIELVDLGLTPGPNAGDEVTYTNAEGASAVLTAQVADPFTEHDPDRPPEAGTRYVVVTVSVDNVGQQPYPADGYYVVLRDADGRIHFRQGVPRPADAMMPELESQNMAPGNRISGIVGFIVPADARITGVHYQPESYRQIVLADLAGGPAPAPVSEATPAPAATPEPAPAATPEPPAPAASPEPDPSAGTGK